MTMPAVAAVLSLAIAAAAPAAERPDLGRLPLNEIQVIGSHNSYKLAPQPEFFDAMLRVDPGATGIDYGHLSLRDQLALGLRNLELDLYHDPEGGRYAEPLGNRLLEAQGGEPWPFDPSGELDSPGFKIMHEANFDFLTHNYTFADALQELEAWSDRNPRHVPVIVTLNPKTGGPDFPGAVSGLPFDEAAMDALDAEIRDAMEEGDSFTPDMLRGEAANVREAVAGEGATGWPAVDEVRGRFIFVLDAGGSARETYKRPEGSGRPPLDGRVVFTTGTGLDDPAAAFFVINDPVRDQSRIREAVAAGFIVRTRSDANTTEMRAGDRSRFEAAKESGAQVITTDYYIPDLRHNPRFVIRFDARESPHPFVRERPGR